MVKCSVILASTGSKVWPSVISGSSRASSGASSSASVLNDALKRRSISFQPGVRMVFPLAVNSFPAQVNVAVTASYTWGAATAHSSLQHTRDSSFFSPSVSPSKPFCTNSIVGIMAWWSDTFLLFSTRPNCGAMSSPAAKESSGHRPDTMLSAVGCISSVRY